MARKHQPKRIKRRNPHAKQLTDPRFHKRVVPDKRKKEAKKACRVRHKGDTGADVFYAATA